MKNVKSIIIVLGIIAATHVVCTAENLSKYEQTMLASIGQMYGSSTVEAYIESANTFARIANAEGDKWEPLYYQALSYLLASTNTADLETKDSYLDNALAVTNKGLERSANNAELIVLKGWVYTMLITVDPAARGQQYTPMAFEELNKALAIDSDNPRALFLIARMKFEMAKMFGDKTDEPCAMAQKAAQITETEQPESPLSPSWQKYAIDELIQLCGQ